MSPWQQVLDLPGGAHVVLTEVGAAEVEVTAHVVLVLAEVEVEVTDAQGRTRLGYAPTLGQAVSLAYDMTEPTRCA